MTTKLTAKDRQVLQALATVKEARAYGIAHLAGIRTMSPRETAARHLIRLVKGGMAEQIGTRMFPVWKITEAGRAILFKAEQSP